MSGWGWSLTRIRVAVLRRRYRATRYEPTGLPPDGYRTGLATIGRWGHCRSCYGPAEAFYCAGCALGMANAERDDERNAARRPSAFTERRAAMDFADIGDCDPWSSYELRPVEDERRSIHLR